MDMFSEFGHWTQAVYFWMEGVNFWK